MINLNDNERRWARALLIIYPRTKRILNMLDESRRQIARSGFTTPGTEMLYQRIIDVNYRMEGIMNIRLIVHTALKNLAGAYRDILKLRHVEGRSIAELAEYEGTSVRNCFRRYDRALTAFFREVVGFGYDVEKLNREYAGDNLIMNIYRRANGKIFSRDVRESEKKRAKKAPRVKNPSAFPYSEFIKSEDQSKSSKSS